MFQFYYFFFISRCFDHFWKPLSKFLNLNVFISPVFVTDNGVIGIPKDEHIVFKFVCIFLPRLFSVVLQRHLKNGRF